jgi:hypothetical protein
LYLTQTQHIHSLLTKTKLDGAKPFNTPMQPGQQLSKFSGTVLPDPTEYRITVGALQYATITKLDISFSVNKVSQFTTSPTDQHWITVKCILRYLKGSLDCGLKLQPSSSLCLSAVTDADWVGYPDDRKSTMGFGIFLGSNLISWSSKKHANVFRSSTETEYRSLAMATTELLWLQSLLSELGIKPTSPPVLWCDNLDATFLAANPVLHAITKHIEINFHSIRDQIAQKRLAVKFISSAYQLGDIFTKSLASDRFKDLCAKLTLSVRPYRLCGGGGCRSVKQSATG